MSELSNKELISRITNLFDNGGVDRNSLYNLLLSVPLDNDPTMSAKLSSVRDNNISKLFNSPSFSNSTERDRINSSIALDLATRSTNADLLNPHTASPADRQAIIDGVVSQYAGAIATSNNPSATAREVAEASASYANQLSRVMNPTHNKSYQSSELSLSSKISALMSNNITQSLGNAAMDAMNNKFDASKLLKNLSNDLPWGLGKWSNQLLSNYDYSQYENITNQISNPNKPQIQVDQVVCWIKDISSPGNYTPPFEIIHHPAGFTDQVSHNYSSDTIIGRTSPIMGYNATSRNVSFDFMVLEDFQPFSIEETVRFLKGMTYPSYDYKTNKLIPPKVLIHVGQFSEIVVIDSVSVTYQENPVRDGKYIAAQISVSGEVVPPTDGYLEYKEQFFKGNSYAENKLFKNRAGAMSSLTDAAMVELGKQINNLLAPINARANEIGAQIVNRGNKLVNDLLSKLSNYAGLDLSPLGGLLSLNKDQRDKSASDLFGRLQSGEFGSLIKNATNSNPLVNSRNNSLTNTPLKSWNSVGQFRLGNSSDQSWIGGVTKSVHSNIFK